MSAHWYLALQHGLSHTTTFTLINFPPLWGDKQPVCCIRQAK
ncbi:MAG: hypothetical protein N6V49_01540 [Serratia symbiotica]|nr:hypothetical protein [Serratia symbiotica]